MSSAVGGQTLDGGDLGTSGLHGEDEARADGGTVEQHGACATHAVLTTEVRALQPALVAEVVGERQAWLDARAVRTSPFTMSSISVISVTGQLLT